MSAAARLCVRCHQPLGEASSARSTASTSSTLKAPSSWPPRRAPHLLARQRPHLHIHARHRLDHLVVHRRPARPEPGKAVTGIRVIRTTATPCAPAACSSGGWPAPWPASSLLPGRAWILWDRDAQTLHDKIVNTVVVRPKAPRRSSNTAASVRCRKASCRHPCTRRPSGSPLRPRRPARRRSRRSSVSPTCDRRS